MPITNNTNRPVTNIPTSELKGKAIKQDENKIASTPSHDIQMNTDYMMRDGEALHMPDFKLKLRKIEDPAAKAKIIDVPAADLAAIEKGADFKAKLNSLMEANKDFLNPKKETLLESLPEGELLNYAYNNIIGRRNEQFFEEAGKLIAKTGLTGDEAKTARRELNFAHRDAFRGRAINFDKADTGSYWSYGQDKPFTHVYEKMLAALPEGDPKRESIQNQLDYIYTKKYVTSGKVDENNAEKSMGIIAIDKSNRNVVSMTEGSEQGMRVSYETLSVPQGEGEHAGKAVYRDGDKHYFQGGREEVPADLVTKLDRKPVDEVVFRKLKDGEQLRENFRFDWNSNRMLDTEKINTGWWGHCDIKATMETILTDMKGSGGVNEFNSASGKTTNYTKADQLEGLSSILNFGDGYAVDGQRRAVSLSTTEFAGGRFDDRPTTMNLNIGGREMEIRVRLKDLKKGEEDLDIKKTFATKMLDDKNESFTDNPDILRVEGRDTNFINGKEMTITGTTDGYSFDDQGRPVESKTPFVIDPNATEGERQLVGTTLRDIQNRELDRIYYDPATKELTSVSTTFVKNDEGKYEAKEGTSSKLGNVSGVELGREMEGGDDIEGKLDLSRKPFVPVIKWRPTAIPASKCGMARFIAFVRKRIGVAPMVNGSV